MLELPERDEEPSGELRLTAPNDFGAIVLPDILSHFLRRYPQIHFDVRLTNARTDLVAEGFDLAIRAAPTGMKGSALTVRRLGTAGGELYAAPSHVARRGRPKLLADPKHDWIMHPHMMATLKVPKHSVRFRCDDFLLARDLVRDGAGVALLYPSSGHVPRKVSAFRDFLVDRLKTAPLAS